MIHVEIVAFLKKKSSQGLPLPPKSIGQAIYPPPRIKAGWQSNSIVVGRLRSWTTRFRPETARTLIHNSSRRCSYIRSGTKFVLSGILIGLHLQSNITNV